MRFGRYSVTCSPPPTGPRNAEPRPAPDPLKKRLEAAERVCEAVDAYTRDTGLDMKDEWDEMVAALFDWKRVKAGDKA